MRSHLRSLAASALRRLAALGLLIAGALAASGTIVASVVPSDERTVSHALNRLAFGGRPGDVGRVQTLGLAAWIDTQLSPRRLVDASVTVRLEPLTTLTLDPATLAREYVAPARQQRLPRRQILTELSEARLLRAVYSERQLEEVLVDFWFNHFNVFGRKGRIEIYVGEYERTAIRPHVLGNFRDLLGATAKSPAMLFYLDNWMSADPDASERIAMQQRIGRPDAPPRTLARRGRGLNENYARELLELHTLGVDGGYTQQDVVNVARAFTGWTIGRPDMGGFRFVPAMHDRGVKQVLGRTLPAGRGIEDGEEVLDVLAGHPSTAHHVAFKLAQRFVGDRPPPRLVDHAARVFTTTRGNLREVVAAIVTAPEFFAPEAYRAKVKTPFEFVASALRATGADVRSAAPVVRALAGLGMPLYLCQPPTGYHETADTWVSSGALVNRLNFALAMAGGEMPGVHLPELATMPPAAARIRVIRDALSGDISAATRATVNTADSTAKAIALVIGSPEFQRQ